MPRHATPSTPERRSAAARVAATARYHPDEVDDARRELTALQISDTLAHLLKQSPQLTSEQVRQIGQILREPR